MKSIKEIIKEVILNNTTRKVEIDDSNFFAVIASEENENSKKNEKNQKLFNFVVFAVVLIFCIAMLISSFVFFISDILLYQNTPKINAQGAIVSERSSNRETAIFLFNAAERWANTGIQLQKGDIIKISYSGGFHSDISVLKKSAENNAIPKYKWNSFSTTPKDSTSKNSLVTQKLLYHNKSTNVRFGSLLRVIAGEIGVQESDTIHFEQVTQNEPKDAEQNGTLYLAINDIYLSDNVINLYAEENKSRWRDLYSIIENDTLVYKTTFIKNQNKRDSTDLFFKEDSVFYIAGSKFRELAVKNRDLFYNDNLGEVLVVVDIKRNVSAFSWRQNWYRWTEENINKIWDEDNIGLLPSNWLPIKILRTVVVFIMSVVMLIVNIILFLCVVWFVSIPILCALIFVFYKKHRNKIKIWFRKCKQAVLHQEMGCRHYERRKNKKIKK